MFLAEVRIANSYLRVKPKVWAGNDIALKSKQHYEMNIDLLSFTVAECKTLITKCRVQGVTMTGLLHGVMAAVFARKFPEARALQGHTPYSMSPYTGYETKEQMVNQTSDNGCLYDGSLLIDLRSFTDDLTTVWEAAGVFHSGLQEEFKRIPVDNDLAGLKWLDLRTM